MKNIRNILISIIALVFVSSCQKFSVGEVHGATEEVRITLNAPVLATKAIGEGENAKMLYYTAFVDGNVVPSLCRTADLDPSGKTVLDMKLVKNVKYRFVFWAQTPVAEGSPQYYDLSTFYADSKVKVNYQVSANDDLRDAFWAVKDVEVNVEKDVDVKLERPFAQLNLCSSDYEMVKQLDLHTDMTSEMYVYGLPDVMTLLDGSVSSSGEAVGVDAYFSPSAIPDGEDEYITVSNKQYGYVGMNYVLAPEAGTLVSVKAAYINDATTWETGLLPEVPVKRNFKTNILGEMFVEHGTLTIEILPAFKDDEIVVID